MFNRTVEQTGPVGPSLTILEFCAKHRLSRPLLYKQVAAGKLRISKIGARSIITAENEAAYIRSL
jgi:hypothetical protein